MAKVRNTSRGFPGGCPLPEALATKVLASTNRRTRGACKVCIHTMAAETKNYREKCSWWQGIQKAF